MNVNVVARNFLRVAFVLLVTMQGYSQSAFYKVTDDLDKKYTTVGNIGLTITNYGTIGTRNAYWPTQPSCEYPRGSFKEHIYQGGLWIGALVKTQDPNDGRNNQILVTTATNDQAGASRRGSQGYEFTTQNGDTITELSTLSDSRPATAQYSLSAVSHQDFICDYSDTNTRVPATNDSILYHTPLKVKVHQESYAWNFPFADFFVILRYVIYNASPDTLDSVYVGYWDNASVRYTSRSGGVVPGTPGYYDRTGQGYDSLQRMAYSFDFDGQPGNKPANSYVGLKLLGTYPFPNGVDSLGDLYRNTRYSVWQFRLSSGDNDFYSPTDDWNSQWPLSRYSRMTGAQPSSVIPPLRVQPRNVSYLVSTGPFSRLNPGDSLEVVYAVVCAPKAGILPPNLDLPEQRKTLYTNAGWAQQAYNGEDVNGNDSLDAGEDVARRDEFGLQYVPDGKITRYLLPTPPRNPKVRAVVENQSIVVYWDKSNAELSTDPISGLKDFEGYRVYSSKTGSDFLTPDQFISNLQLVGEFDRTDDSIGYNTGFGRILMPTPKTFEGDSVDYWYRFPPVGTEVKLLNGWQYVYAVTAYDQGDTNVISLESSKQLMRLVPGTLPTSASSDEIGVYPNPYYANAYWDGSRERQRKIYFFNLPSRSTITIYTLSGDVVARLDHDAATYDGSEIDWFNQFGDRSTKAQFAGGEHAWDLITKYDQAIATGLYLFTVEDKSNGNIKRGKFLVVK